MTSGTRNGKRFTIPSSHGVEPPSRPLSQVQSERLGELWLVHCIAGILLFHWRSRVDAAGTLEMLIDVVGGQAVSRKEAEELLTDDGDEDDSNPPMAMLWAATCWFTALDLPRSRAVLWSGRPNRIPAR